MSNVLKSAPWLSAMARVFDRAGAPLYMVGGAVRNPLMGLPATDVDLCGPALPEEICRFCEGTQVRAKVRTYAMGTVELYADGQMAEYTAWRQDVYTLGHTPSEVRFVQDIHLDARRRDFSVNALYRRLHDGWTEDVIDPTGGLLHLEQGILHTTTENPELILAHDGQRILRAARFQAELGLTPSASMMASLRRNAGLVRELSFELIKGDILRLVMAPSALEGLKTLRKTGVWDFLFPGLGFDESAVLDGSSLEKRLSALFAAADPDRVQEALLRLRLPNREAGLVRRVIWLSQNPDAPLRLLAACGPDALALCPAALQRLHGKPLSVRDLAVSGNDVKPLLLAQNRPMKDMGRVLDSLWERVLSGELPNEKQALLDAANPLP